MESKNVNTIKPISKCEMQIDKETLSAADESAKTTMTNSEHEDSYEYEAASSSQAAVSAFDSTNSSAASVQLAAGLLQIMEPPLATVRSQLKELIAKQNKIYVDLSAEKYKLDNVEVAQLQEMMISVKVYKEKALKIKKQMQQIYQRSQSLKKRAQNIEAYKRKELERKLQKQEQEEALIRK